MRQTADSMPGLVAVDKYLLPREVKVATVRRHPAVLIGPSAMALGGLLLAGILSASVLHGNGTLLAVVWILWALLVLRLIWVAVNWAVDYFVVTSERILLTSGLLTRNISMMPLTKVTDMRFRRSFAGRLLGYGEFIVESAGQEQALRNIDHIPFPEQLYLLICGMIFPDSADEDDGGGSLADAEGGPNFDEAAYSAFRRDSKRNDDHRRDMTDEL